MANKITIVELYKRVCKDSKYELDYGLASSYVAELLDIRPLGVWSAVGSIDLLVRISEGDVIS